ncbi:hypothetical protein [Rhizobium sp. OAE497]|jgi:hypothetical protein|uniref:hypothetical protein n=1 Tax=Rhizobium sp. OAE497 TaxID=2663796 RepID=UPI000DD60C15
MAMISLTKVRPAGQRIVINTKHLAALEPYGDGTIVYLALPNEKGTPFSFTVTDALEKILAEISKGW